MPTFDFQIVHTKLKVLFLAPYPHDQAPSQRFRFELFLKSLETRGIAYDFEGFWDDEGWEVLYTDKSPWVKLFHLVRGFARRKVLLFKIPRYDLVFIHREASPIGPPFLEWCIARLLRKKVIYDFDDAIWLTNTSEENLIAKSVKWHHKVNNICRWSWKISVGNSYLADHAQQFNKNVQVFPTVIDSQHHHPLIDTQRPKPESRVPVMGWTGTHSTLKYLNPLLPVLQRIQSSHDFCFQVIADKDPALPLKDYQFVKWSQKNEVSDLQGLDIGIMPLTDDPWSKGKCGFKAIQYGSVGIPALVSPVGVNKDVVVDGITGFHCNSEEDWHNRIVQCLENPELRKSLGQAGRGHIIKYYSVESQREKFFELLGQLRSLPT